MIKLVLLSIGFMDIDSAVRPVRDCLPRRAIAVVNVLLRMIVLCCTSEYFVCVLRCIVLYCTRACTYFLPYL